MPDLLLKVSGDLQRPKTLVQTLARMDGMKRGMMVGGKYAQGQLMEYPVQPAGVEYVRRGMAGGLKSKWTTKASDGGFTVTTGNNAEHVIPVQWKQVQRYFKRVWANHSVKAVIKRITPKIRSIVSTEIRRSL